MTDGPVIRVLLIDDDESAYPLMRTILDRIPSARFDLEHAGTVEDGERRIAQGVHDVYLVDYLLGEDSGIEIVRRARRTRSLAPMILITGKGRYEVDVEAMEAGVSDYLDKSKLDADVVERSIRYSIDRARAQTALRESEARHRSMFDHLPIGLYRISTDGELLDANPALWQLLGRPDRDSLEYVYARNLFVNHAHRQSFLSQLEQFGVVRGFESRLVRPDGQVVRVRNAARAHRGHDGTPLYIEGAVEDVSEEHEARDLHGRAARFSWVFNASGLAIVLLDLDGHVIDANPAFLRALGYDLDELRQRPLRDLADDSDRAALAGELRRVSNGLTEVSEAHRRFVASDDEIIWARTRSGLVRSAKGHPDHMLVLLEDLAEA